MLLLPNKYLHVRYVSARIPGGDHQDDMTLGANCQVFAYSILRFFGKETPDFRSSELWSDDQLTYQVNQFEALDIMLYNSRAEAYGAHVGLYFGEGWVLHLSKDNGTPVLEKHETLMRNSKYHFFIGAKRLKN